MGERLSLHLQTSKETPVFIFMSHSVAFPGPGQMVPSSVQSPHSSQRTAFSVTTLPFVHSSIHPIFLSTGYVPGTILDSKTAVTETIPVPVG